LGVEDQRKMAATGKKKLNRETTGDGRSYSIRHMHLAHHCPGVGCFHVECEGKNKNTPKGRLVAGHYQPHAAVTLKMAATVYDKILASFNYGFL